MDNEVEVGPRNKEWLNVNVRWKITAEKHMGDDILQNRSWPRIMDTVF